VRRENIEAFDLRADPAELRPARIDAGEIPSVLGCTPGPHERALLFRLRAANA
jgi:hypothetical protein